MSIEIIKTTDGDYRLWFGDLLLADCGKDEERAKATARSIVEAFAKIADDVAGAHQKIGAQGRFTADYRQGAIDAARHVAHLIRKSIAQ